MDNVASIAEVRNGIMGIDRMRAQSEDWMDLPCPGPSRMLIEGGLPAEKPGLLAAIGAGGKTTMAWDQALSLAYPAPGQEWMGKRIVGEGCKVMIVTREDTKAEALGIFHDLGGPERRRAWQERTGSAEKRLHLESMEVATSLVSTSREGLMRSDYFDQITDYAGEFGAGITYFDTCSKLGHGINFDNSTGETAWFADQLAAFCMRSSSSALGLHHVSKAGMGDIKSMTDMREKIKGSAGLIDGVRFVLGLWTPWATLVDAIVDAGVHDKPEDVFLFGAPKSNIRGGRMDTFKPRLMIRSTRFGQYEDRTAEAARRIEDWDRILMGRAPAKAKAKADDKPAAKPRASRSK